jgi:hypothetical protein
MQQAMEGEVREQTHKVGKPRMKLALGKPRRRCEDNMKMEPDS